MNKKERTSKDRRSFLKTTGAALATSAVAGVGTAQETGDTEATFSGMIAEEYNLGNVHYFTPETDTDVELELQVDTAEQTADSKWQLLLTYDGSKPELGGWAEFNEPNYDDYKTTTSSVGTWTIDNVTAGQKIGLRVFCDTGPGEYTLTASQDEDGSGSLDWWPLW